MTRVLFLCTGNSCRSQMAEGWLRHVAGDRFVVMSAGTQPSGLNATAVQVMGERGIDIAGQRSKSVDEFAKQSFDYVITVCDNAKESCPVFPGGGSRLHWSFDDPATAHGTDEQRVNVFRRVRDDIEKRIREFSSGKLKIGVAVSDTFAFQPIGFVSSPYADTAQIPKGLGAKHEAEGALNIRPEFELGLTDIEGFSHLIVIWVFDRSAGFELLGQPPTDDKPHGVFATRSPKRPNPIGLTVVELLRREGDILYVRGIDMLDGTPILDIKPYLSNIPEQDLRRGWLAEAEARKTR